ncbi:hypothetical protein SDC9_137286 [bioreactor metagenome]|uniref:HTH cro/C1-type domain-containing protein n=1 Tax=bioreactor metagenome TaxID=1076179 RepID=A0A645DLJ5_9ZZZZ|nr:helix-turn-helix transcriptional regulator [Clostridium sp. UBA4548]
MATIIKIAEVLESKGKTKYWLSKETGITYPNLDKLIKNETSSIKFDFLEKICTALDCELSDIIEFVKEDDLGK